MEPGTAWDAVSWGVGLFSTARSCALCPEQKQMFLETHEAGVLGPITHTAPSRTNFVFTFFNDIGGLVWVGELKQFIRRSIGDKEDRDASLLGCGYSHREGKNAPE